MDSSHVADLINAAFPGLDLYEIFGVPKEASDTDIKKAYKKKALIHHPDKGGDGEKFKALSCAHAILSDPGKRNTYDKTGELDGSELSDEAAEWYQYFRNMFPKVTVQSIDDFSSKYKSSEEERQDVLKAYVKGKGDIEFIMENVMLAEEEDEGRIVGILNDAIAAKEINALPSWVNRSQVFVSGGVFNFKALLFSFIYKIPFV